jgi:hypothetical protein
MNPPHPLELVNRELRIRLQAAEHALKEERALSADLGEQLDRANAAAVRMARLIARAGMRRAA